MGGKRQQKKHSRQWNQCPLCGDRLPNDLTNCVVGKTGRAVCPKCMKVSSRILDAPPLVQDMISGHDDIISPQEMIRQLDRVIIGQNQAKRAVAVALWKQQLRSQGADLPGSGVLLYGPTGCGKTALVREAARIAGLPFIVFDASTLTEAGYRGNSAEDIPAALIEVWGKEKAAHGVIFLDEVDKLAATYGNEYRGAFSRGTQHSLLKLVEGSEILVKGEHFSTAGIQFFFGGAFTGLQRELEQQASKRSIGFGRNGDVSAGPKTFLPSDFIQYGMEPELMGRIGRCVQLYELTADDLTRILTESELSAFRKYQTFFCRRGRALELDASSIEELVRSALVRNTGARGLNALVEEWIEPRLLHLSEEGQMWNTINTK